jgi:hypothetical protein
MLRSKQGSSIRPLLALWLTLPICLGGCAGSPQSVPQGPLATSDSAIGPVRQAMSFKFRTLDDQTDPRFNELLGINNLHHIVGFYGDGAPAHPNRGYVVYPPYHQINYRQLSFPMSVENQATALNNTKTAAGFYSDSEGEIFGFTDTLNIWSDYQDPHSQGIGTTTELLGINDLGFAVGFYTSKALGHRHAFEVPIATGIYQDLIPPNAVDAVATGINGRGDVVGYVKRANGAILGFLFNDGAYTFYTFPRSTSTEFLGVTVLDRIVGSYIDKSGKSHGFLLMEPLRPNHTTWQSIDDPDGIGTTVVTGINIHYELVGYYVDRFGKTHGFLATPSALLQRHQHRD